MGTLISEVLELNSKLLFIEFVSFHYFRKEKNVKIAFPLFTKLGLTLQELIL